MESLFWFSDDMVCVLEATAVADIHDERECGLAGLGREGRRRGLGGLREDLICSPGPPTQIMAPDVSSFVTRLFSRNEPSSMNLRRILLSPGGFTDDRNKTRVSLGHYPRAVHGR